MRITCPLPDCNSKDATDRSGDRDGLLVDCPNCGRFSISRTFSVTGPFSGSTRLMPGLRAWIRLENSKGSVAQLTRTWEQRAREFQPTSWWDRCFPAA